jgi:DNA-directed RNA polymerase specialized sigma24 family protein
VPGADPKENPMDAEGSITRLIGLAKAGEAEAAEGLWAAYFRKLVALARRKLDAAPRRAADEEDVALSAFKSFWDAARQDRFPRLTDRASLWPLLVAITANKCAEQHRRETRRKRGGGVAPAAVGLEQVVGREPTPEFACQVADELDHLLGRLDATGDPLLRRVAVLRMGGHNPGEIAAALGCARRTVERKLALIERCWAAEVGDEFAG